MKPLLKDTPKFRLSHSMCINVTPALRTLIAVTAQTLKISDSKVAIRAMHHYIEANTKDRKLTKPQHITHTTPTPTRPVQFTFAFPFPAERQTFETLARAQNITVSTLLRRLLLRFTLQALADNNLHPDQNTIAEAQLAASS